MVAVQGSSVGQGGLGARHGDGAVRVPRRFAGAAGWRNRERRQHDIRLAFALANCELSGLGLDRRVRALSGHIRSSRRAGGTLWSAFASARLSLSLIHISEPTRLLSISY